MSRSPHHFETCDVVRSRIDGRKGVVVSHGALTAAVQWEGGSVEEVEQFSHDVVVAIQNGADVEGAGQMSPAEFDQLEEQVRELDRRIDDMEWKLGKLMTERDELQAKLDKPNKRRPGRPIELRAIA